MKKIDVAIVGATGLLGTTLIEVLKERKFPIDKLFLLASKKYDDKAIRFNDKTLTVDALKDFDFNQVDLVFFCAGKKVSEAYVTKAVAAGCKVIDNSSAFRMHPNVPLVIPEVNMHTVKSDDKIIANPNCSTIQMLVALAPLHAANKIKNITISTYQAVSGAGKKAISELVKQLTELLNGRAVDTAIFEQQIAFNVLPCIGEIQDNDYSTEESKMHNETRKILQAATINVDATAVRVPVLYGHSEAISVEFTSPINVEEVTNILSQQQAIELNTTNKPEKFATPFMVGAGGDKVYVSRIRQGVNNPRVINLWVVADNIRKGGVLNSVQIAESLNFN